jgi:hypothetical protein
MAKCGENPTVSEFTLCGRAFDDTEDGAIPPTFAEKGERVTCRDCLRHLRGIREEFKGSTYVGPKKG